MTKKLPKRGLPPMHPGQLLREEIVPFWTILDSIYARARRRPCVTMFGFSRQGR
jgi:hypothetical protein